MARGWVSHGAPAIAVSSFNESIDANEVYQDRPMAHSRKEIDIGETLAEILLDILPKEIKKSGRGREYFEERMLRNWFPDLTEDEKVFVISLTKAVLDRSFPA